MADVDRSAYDDQMVALENKLGKMILDEAEKWDIKKIELFMIMENITEIIKEEAKKERNKRNQDQ